MDFVKTWLGRIIFAAAGVILIATSAGAHGHQQVGGIVTGICAILYAVYATIRGLTGGVEASDTQIIGLINLTAWYDIVIFLVLVAVSVIAWIV